MILRKAIKCNKNHCKPISRILYSRTASCSVNLYHLSTSDITIEIYLPTLRDFLETRKLSEQLSSPNPRDSANQDLRGISTHKVYPPNRLPCQVVRSYHTFSPLPDLRCLYRQMILRR